MNEDLHAGEWIRTKIGTLGNTIAGAYRDVIPEDKKLPAVRFHLQNPDDVRVVGGARIMTKLDWLVVVVNEGLAIAPIVPIADALDTALHDTSGETSDLLILSCVRLHPFHLLEPDQSGVNYRHAGGMYRTIVQPK